MEISIFWFFFFKQKTAYEMRISDWSSDVCSSDLLLQLLQGGACTQRAAAAVLFLLLASSPISARLNAGMSAGLRLETNPLSMKIGRASCRERVCQYV